MNLELFSCSGGMAEGFRRVGVRFDLAFDADPNACDSYEANLGHRPVQMDVRDLLRMVQAGWSPGTVELLVADPPCVPWSRAGKRLGLEDERDMLRITCELIDHLEPRAWMIANVPGLDDSNHWESVVQPVIGRLASDGRYYIDYISLDAADFGVAQHRRRPFWFGRPAGSPCIDWPHPTHCAPPVLPGSGLASWVTCREALAHLPLEELGRPVRVRKRSDGGFPPSQADEPARTVLADVPRLDKGGVVLLANDKHPPSRLDEPALTIPVSQPSNGGSVLTLEDRKPDPNRPPAPPDEPHRAVTTVRDQALLAWPWDRPSTTVFAQTAQTGGPGNGSPGNRPNAVVLSERAAAILQGFPDGTCQIESDVCERRGEQLHRWVFAGKTKRARWGQLGQAMPPPLAEAVARSYVAWRERSRIVGDAPLLNAGARP